jgi:hypothetical protein
MRRKKGSKGKQSTKPTRTTDPTAGLTGADMAPGAGAPMSLGSDAPTTGMPPDMGGQPQGIPPMLGDPGPTDSMSNLDLASLGGPMIPGVTDQGGQGVGMDPTQAGGMAGALGGQGQDLSQGGGIAGVGAPDTPTLDQLLGGQGSPQNQPPDLTTPEGILQAAQSGDPTAMQLLDLEARRRMTGVQG